VDLVRLCYKAHYK